MLPNCSNETKLFTFTLTAGLTDTQERLPSRCGHEPFFTDTTGDVIGNSIRTTIQVTVTITTTPAVVTRSILRIIISSWKRKN